MLDGSFRGGQRLFPLQQCAIDGPGFGTSIFELALAVDTIHWLHCFLVYLSPQSHLLGEETESVSAYLEIRAVYHPNHFSLESLAPPCNLCR